MKKLLLIVNPVSGKMKVKNHLVDIIKVFNKATYTVTVEITTHKGHATEITEMNASAYDIIVCCGGDGTLNEVICGLIRAKAETPIGYIPAGSTNDFANSLGLSSDMAKAAENIVNGKPATLDIGQFNTAYFTYIASFGAFTSVSYNTPQVTKNLLGHTAYILSGIMDIASIKPIHLWIETEDRKIEGDYIFGGIANSTSLGGVLKLKPEIVDMSDGEFEIVLIKKINTVADLNRVVISLATSNYSNKSVEYFRASKIKIRSEEKKLPFTLDGEYMDGTGTVNIKNLHNRLTLIK